ncbi:hypothetical protein D7X33_42535 [Butyricicoccus sp. 1XD8-22]|nr:hypothetical protein D7X33_42535 [Butyricicoccus sp. 1XD8-22]
MVYLDYAFELNKLEGNCDSTEVKRLINQVRYDLLSNSEIDWKHYLFNLLNTIDEISQNSYNEGYKDAIDEHDFDY